MSPALASGPGFGGGAPADRAAAADHPLPLARRLALACLLAALHSDPAPAQPAPATLTARNPLLTAQRVIVSSDGVHAFDRRTLAPAWSALHRQHTLEPVADDAAVYVAGSGGLVALALADGRRLWSTQDRTWTFPPTLAGTRLYLGDRRGRLRALRSSDGGELWRRQFPGWVYGPAVLGRTLASGGSASVLWALDAQSGELLWSRPLSQELVYQPVALGGDILVTTTFDGAVSAYSARGGTLRWRLTGATAAFAPVPVGEWLLLYRLDGSVQALDLRSGQLRWSHRLPGRPAAVPMIGDGEVWVVHSDSRIHVLSLANGELLRALGYPSSIIGTPTQFDGKVVIFVRDPGNPSRPTPVVVGASAHQNFETQRGIPE